MSEKKQQAPEKELKRRFQLWLRPSVLDMSLTILHRYGGYLNASFFLLSIGRSRIYFRRRPQFFRHLYCGFAIGF